LVIDGASQFPALSDALGHIVRESTLTEDGKAEEVDVELSDVPPVSGSHASTSLGSLGLDFLRGKDYNVRRVGDTIVPCYHRQRGRCRHSYVQAPGWEPPAPLSFLVVAHLRTWTSSLAAPPCPRPRREQRHLRRPPLLTLPPDGGAGMSSNRWQMMTGFQIPERADHAVDRVIDTTNATLARRRRISKRIVQDGERTYTAYSADELIALESYGDMGRPGHPY
jgi:hypothetical protein